MVIGPCLCEWIAGKGQEILTQGLIASLGSVTVIHNFCFASDRMVLLEQIQKIALLEVLKQEVLIMIMLFASGISTLMRQPMFPIRLHSVTKATTQ